MTDKMECLSSLFEDFNTIGLKIKGTITDQDSKFQRIAEDAITFIFLKKGKGSLSINSIEYNIAENTLLILLPGNIYSNINFSDDINFEYLHSSLSVVRELSWLTGINIYEIFYVCPCINLDREEFNNLLEFKAFIVRQYDRKDHPHQEILVKVLLTSFIIEISGLYREYPNKHIGIDRNKKLFLQFNKLLFENIKKERSVQFYAERMCLSSKYASRIIKEVGGKSIAESIAEWTISSIKLMLKTTDRTIIQISDELNFPNPSFMGRYFKKRTGMTPLQYRNSK